MTDLTGILGGLERRFGPVESEPTPLDGGITNRNYLIGIGGRDCVLRLPGKDTDLLGIDREAERLAARQAATLGIGPELLYADADCSLTVYVAGALPASPGPLQADPAPFARALRRFHDSGLELPTRFWVPDLLDTYAALLSGRHVNPPPRFEHARAVAARVARTLPLTQPVPCHNDLLPGNILASASAGVPVFVDWEYAGMGHRLFDLANLAVNNELDERGELALLEAYYEEAPVRPDRRAALALMKLCSDAREAAWGVVQQELSALEFDFAGYAAQHFDRLEHAAADERLTELLRDAASA